MVRKMKTPKPFPKPASAQSYVGWVLENKVTMIVAQIQNPPCNVTMT